MLIANKEGIVVICTPKCIGDNIMIEGQQRGSGGAGEGEYQMHGLFLSAASPISGEQ